MLTTTVPNGTVPVLSAPVGGASRFFVKPDYKTRTIPAPANAVEAKLAAQLSNLVQISRQWDRRFDIGETGIPNMFGDSTNQANWISVARLMFAIFDREGWAVNTWSTGAYWTPTDTTATYTSSAGQYNSLNMANPSAPGYEPSYTNVTGRGVGVNLISLGIPGGDNNVGPAFSNLNPGYYGYQYLDDTTNTINYLASRNMTMVRLCVSHERMTQGGPGTPFTESYMALVDSVISRCNTAGLFVQLNVLNSYNYYKATTAGQSTVPNYIAGAGDGVYTLAAVTDFYTRLANRYKANSNVSFDLMNEPHGYPLSDADSITLVNSLHQRAVDAIRMTGATNHINIELFPYSNFVEAVKTQNNPSPPIDDPCGKYGHSYSFHCYPDDNRSGQYATPFATEVSNSASYGFGNQRLYRDVIFP